MKIDNKIKVISYLPLVVGMASLAHALFPSGILFLGLLFVFIYLDLKLQFYLSNSVLTPLGIIGALVAIIFAFRMPFEAIAYLIMFLSLIKMLGKKTMRDLKQIIALSFFNFVDSAIFHYTAIFLIYLLLYIIAVLVALLVITFLDEKKSLSLEGDLFKVLSTYGIYMGIGVIFLSIFFFLILPRSPYVLLRPQIYASFRRSGFENQLEINKLQNELNNNQILMRVKPVLREKLPYTYIRGPVYNIYENNAWVRKPEHIAVKEKESGKGWLKGYYISLEPMKTSFLYAPSFPEAIELRGFKFYRSWGKTFLIEGGEIFRKIEYRAFCSDTPDTVWIDTLDVITVPKELESSIDNAISKLDLDGIDKKELPLKLERTLKGQFVYAIKSFPDSSWIEDFLREKVGYCVHFATLSALILRRMGIPARVVGGFLSDEWNDFGHYYVIKAKHAHMWVEYYDGSKWNTIDPTPPRPKEREILSSLKAYVDYLAYLWTTQVLEFSFTHQMLLFSNLRRFFAVKGKKHLFTFILGFALTILVLFLGCRILAKKNKKEHVTTKIFKEFLKVLKSKGFEIHEGMTAEEILQKINTPIAKEFIEVYWECRFSHRCDINALKEKFYLFKKSIS